MSNLATSTQVTDNTPFAGLNCQNGTPAAQSAPQIQQNVSKILNALGASAECKTAMSNTMAESSASGGFSGGGFGDMGFFGFGGNFQSSSMATTNTLQKAGCGDVVTNIKSVIDNISSINCTLNKSSSTSSIAASANCSVILNVVQPPGYMAQLLAANEQLTSQMTQLAALNTSNPSTMLMINNLIASMNDQISENESLMGGSVDLFNSTITVAASTQIRQLNQNVAQLTSNVKQAYTNIVNASANQKISQNGGFGSSTAQIKQLVSSAVQEQQQKINSNISETLTSTSVDVQSESQIVITAPQSIVLVNDTLTTSSLIDMVTTSLTISAIRMGVQVALQLLTTMATTQTTTQTNAGESQALNVLKDAQGNAIGAQMKSLNTIAKVSNPLTALSGITSMGFQGLEIFGVIAVIGVVVYLVVTHSNSSSSASTARTKEQADREAEFNSHAGAKFRSAATYGTRHRTRAASSPPLSSASSKIPRHTNGTPSAPPTTSLRDDFVNGNALACRDTRQVHTKHVIDLVAKGMFVAWTVYCIYLMSKDGLGKMLGGIFSGNLLAIFDIFGMLVPIIQLIVGCACFYLYSWMFWNEPGIFGPLFKAHY